MKKDQVVSGDQFEKQKKKWEETVRNENALLVAENEQLLAKINKMKLDESSNKVQFGKSDSNEIEMLKQKLLLEQEEFRKVRSKDYLI